MSDRIDEMSNEELERRGHSEHVLRAELERVDRFVSDRVTTGDDLSYWHNRHRIIGKLLGTGLRSALL